MNQLNGHKEFARVVADNYSEMEDHLQQAAAENHRLSVENGVLLAECNMLREALALAERERMRLQAVSSTFGGQARALQSVFHSIVELAIKNGYEAAEQAAQQPQAAPQKPEPIDASEIAPQRKSSGAPPVVDWETKVRANSRDDY
jgi:hypothetical protein